MVLLLLVVLLPQPVGCPLPGNEGEAASDPAGPSPCAVLPVLLQPTTGEYCQGYSLMFRR